MLVGGVLVGLCGWVMVGGYLLLCCFVVFSDLSMSGFNLDGELPQSLSNLFALRYAGWGRCVCMCMHFFGSALWF